jgi:hypothetical protein
MCAVDMRIVPGGNPLIHLHQPALQVLFEPGQLLLNGLLEEWEPRASDQGVLLLPALIVQQIVFKTAKADTVSAEDVSGLQPSAEKQIDQKLIAVGAQALLISRLLGIEIALHLGWEPAERKGRGGLLTEGASLSPHRLQKLDGLQEGTVGRGRGEIDSQQDRSEMALKLGSQTINMVLLKGGFVEVALRRDMVGNHIQLLAFENLKGGGLDVLEGRLGGNTLVGKEFEDVSGFGEVLVAFHPSGIHPLLGGGVRRVHVLSDVMNQAVEHMVMEALIPVVHKTQEVQRPQPDIEALQPVDRIIRHQRGIVFDTFGGNVELR